MRIPIFSPEQQQRQREDFIHASVPFIDQMVRLEELMPLTFIKHKDGTLEPTKELWPGWALQMHAEIEKTLEELRHRAGLE